ncbi:Type IV fimbrial assembly, ATPase PilB [Candidatus Burkholderia verschuerenii]|uniref:Type IV fimbrial assembly, ATPase PilB n=1 Tax=Candidatus Burkholderia verschuerenii TaxID=242163 RepID=A0A0L0MB56_9BURK|nr:GspE/PulE family protein [Candidatus Burkholderia verschuerenii]KND59505.1 Type IV fimbrial assembly, ATPase PilB [Candidatus Burkholderia verschuerenii]
MNHGSSPRCAARHAPRATRQQQAWDDARHDPAAYLHGVAQTLGLRGFDAAALDTLDTLEPRFDLLSFGDAMARKCLLAAAPDDTRVSLWLLLADPFDATLRAWAMNRVKKPFAFAVPSELMAFLARHESAHQALTQISVEGSAAAATDAGVEITLATLAADVHPVIRLVNSSLYDALRARASDIHIESTKTGLVIKYRIDGVLQETAVAPGVDTAEQVLSRLKVMADLDIGERRIPQDGRFKAIINQREIDFRVSIMPSIHGEDAVLRVLDKQRGEAGSSALRLDSIGHEPEIVAAIRSIAHEPYGGLLLVTGPTGLGKSTTLYATLTEINTGDEKIITIEDPVEYELPGVLQIPINDKKGLTFARGLRSILRHDPDKILVGEIRDGETAGIAVQAALTGHLVLTSVHANNVFSVLDRFLHMGVDLHSFVDALLGAVAQRLMRKNCPHCLIDDTPPDDATLRASALTREQVANWRFRRGAGCELCRRTGYLGRQPIAEVLRLNDAIKQCFVERRPIVELKQLACDSGFLPLRSIALRSVADGRTTLAEVNRVTMVEA